MAGVGSAVATVITGLADAVKAGIEWARKKKEQDQAEGQKVLDQMKQEGAEIDDRTKQAGAPR